MRHIKTQRFKKAFAALPPAVKARALKAFTLFCQDMAHPSLGIERIAGYPGVWSGRISQKYRWTFHFEQDTETGERIYVHRVIGAHDDVYEKP
ncbi:MAG: type II toxin-antitoxin system RelE family toxin [Anaerolineae bacterium]